MKFYGDFENSIFDLYKLKAGRKVMIKTGNFEDVYSRLQRLALGKAERMPSAFGYDSGKIEVYTNPDTGIVYYIEYKGKGEL